MFSKVRSSVLVNSLRICKSLQRQTSTSYKALKFEKYGEPLDVLKIVEDCAEKPKDKEVLVKILAAPINPADINTIQGIIVYSIALQGFSLLQLL